MKILVINAGSSSLKYQLFDMDTGSVMAKGVCERIGIAGSTITHKRGGEKFVREVPIADHDVAISLVLGAITDPKIGVIHDISEIDAIGHRILHGGSKIKASSLIDEELMQYIRELIPMNPLHAPAVLKGLEAARKLLPGKPNVGVFDTSYYSTLPDYAYTYAIPYEYYEKYGIRKYGFHGTSHRYVCQKAAEMLGRPLNELKIITCHIGSGSSITATMYGKAVDTTMGFTPNDGVVMGTRCGAMDPSVLPYLMNAAHLSADEVEEMINKKSGLLGLSGVSSDCLKVMNEAAAGNDRCRLAMDVFYYSIRKIIGAFLAEMNGADAIVFTAGIGENDKIVRANICKDMDFLGIVMDTDVNAAAGRGEQLDLTGKGSKVKVLVIPTDEEMMIAKDTADLIKK